MEKSAVPLLAVKDLEVSFSMYERGIQKKYLKVIQSLDIDVHKGEIVAIIGSSGSGKSLLASAIFGILPKNAVVSGSIQYQGEELTPKRRKELLGTRLALIPQSVDYLDPLMKVGKQVIGVKSTRRAQREAFSRYGLQRRVEGMFPFQLSGGMARRVLITTAVTVGAELIIADEPTPGLELDLALETLKHFRQLADEGAGVLLITHDVDLALNVADRIGVFYAGTTVEIAAASDFQDGGKALRHPYSKAFIAALPQNGFCPIPGAQPYAGSLPAGCLFADRCSDRTEECAADIPMRPLRGGEVRCIHGT